MLLPATYVSCDEVERADAFTLGYRTVCQHPAEVGVLEASDILVMDINHVLFEDHELAIEKANDAARRGVLVGIHTYYPEALKLRRLAMLPNVLVAKTHRRLLHKVGRFAKLRARPRQKSANLAKSLKGTANHVRESEGAIG